MVVELEDHVVAHGRLDDRGKVDRELVLVAGVADHVDVRVGHHAQQRLGVLGAVALVEAGQRVEAHRHEVELVEHAVGQVDAVLLGKRGIGLAALEDANAVEHARHDLEIPEVPEVRALGHGGTVVGHGDELESPRLGGDGEFGHGRVRVTRGDRVRVEVGEQAHYCAPSAPAGVVAPEPCSCATRQRW